MNKAVKKLIQARNLMKFDHKVVKVEYRPNFDRQTGECYDNAADEAALYPGTKVVAGWIVGDWNGRMAPVIAHFWNYDPKTNTHYDTTPTGYVNTTETEHYIVDNSIFDYDSADYGCYPRIAMLSGNNMRVVGHKISIDTDKIDNKSLQSIYNIIKEIETAS